MKCSGSKDELIRKFISVDESYLQRLFQPLTPAQRSFAEYCLHEARTSGDENAEISSIRPGVVLSCKNVQDFSDGSSLSMTTVSSMMDLFNDRERRVSNVYHEVQHSNPNYVPRAVTRFHTAQNSLENVGTWNSVFQAPKDVHFIPFLETETKWCGIVFNRNTKRTKTEQAMICDFHQ